MGLQMHGVMGVLAHHCYATNKSPTALGHNWWPCFHLNTAFQAHESGLRFGLSHETSTDCWVLLRDMPWDDKGYMPWKCVSVGT
jgi:hypothetical protein